MVEKLKNRNDELNLAIKYPDVYGYLISAWSSIESGIDGRATSTKHDDGKILKCNEKIKH